MKAREEGECSGPRRRKTRRVRRWEEGMLVSAAALDRQTLRGRQLCPDRLAVEKNEPPNTNHKGNAINHEQDPANHLQALRRQSRRIRIRGKLREKCNRNPDEAKKDRKATPTQKRNARPVAKIKESNAGRDSEEGRTEHKALQAKHECSRRRRKFGGSAGQLDHQHSEKCDGTTQKKE